MNPYIYTGPVTSANAFYDYKRAFNDMIQDVIAPETGRQSYAIVAGAKMGKTSMLRCVENRLLLDAKNLLYHKSYPRVIVPIYLDIRAMPDDNASITYFFERLMHKMAESALLHEVLPKSSDLFQEMRKTSKVPEPALHLSQLLYMMTETIQKERPFMQLRVVLLLDELFHLKAHRNSLILSGILRSFHIEPLTEYTVAYVISGDYQVFKSTDASIIDGLLKRMNLHVFDKEVASSVINDPLERKLTDVVVERVFRETGGHPFLLQYLMASLYEHELWPNFTEDDINSTVEQLSEKPPLQQLSTIWQGLDETERNIYTAFCQKRSLSIKDIDTMELHTVSPHGKSRISVSAIRNSITILLTTGLIRMKEQIDDTTIYEIAGVWPMRFLQKIIG